MEDNKIKFLIIPTDSFDNFSAHSVEIWSKKFPTAEHAYQWKKYNDSRPELAEQILETRSPFAAKNVSDTHRELISPAWNDQKVGVMEQIVRAKLEQHEDIQKLLRKSGEQVIIENSPTDIFWGAGLEGQGQNMLGKIWMKLRAELK